MVDDFAGDAAVVVLVLNADASALVVDFAREQRFVVAIFVVVGIDDLAARRLLHREVVASDGHHAPSPFDFFEAKTEMSAETRDQGITELAEFTPVETGRQAISKGCRPAAPYTAPSTSLTTTASSPSVCLR
jgi:hypothetical protein